MAFLLHSLCIREINTGCLQRTLEMIYSILIFFYMERIMKRGCVDLRIAQLVSGENRSTVTLYIAIKMRS